MSDFNRWRSLERTYRRGTRDGKTSFRQTLREIEKVRPVIADPGGCANCGRNESGHYWSTSCVSRVYTAPTQLQRKERMIARRMLKELTDERE